MPSLEWTYFEWEKNFLIAKGWYFSFDYYWLPYLISAVYVALIGREG